MFKPADVETLVKKLYQTLPSGLQNLEQDIQAQFKEILHAFFARLDLVTREEFDVQAKVLARTREKVDTLQAQVTTFIQEKINVK